MTVDSGPHWLIGRGIADVTGDPWGVGMMGYGMRFQRTRGIHLRQRARAFVIEDPRSATRVALVVADIGMFFRNVREAVLRRLDPSRYDDSNVVLTATHTHAGVGGYSCYRLYNMTSGFQPRVFNAIVDGVVAAVEQADADLAPGRLLLARGELHDASVNRSASAFDRNPDDDKHHFPERIDPTTTLLRLERDGTLVGAINWFATHGTSLSNRNTLISGDNKGYAAYRWEREITGVDYGEQPQFVAAFAQSNAGDMSPNVPDATRGPTRDEFENTRIIGGRQCDEAIALATGPAEEVVGGIDVRTSYVRLPELLVDAEFTGDGTRHRTGRAVLGAAFAAGTKEGRGAAFCHEGVDANPWLFAASRAAYRLRPAVRDAQYPKAMLIPTGALGWTAEVLPIQLVRIGRLVLVALAQEVTIVAGLRLRRAVAEVLGVTVEDVIVQGYANDYAGYLTTPEEYDAQRYEGGHTMFGRWQLAAYLQEVVRLARELRDAIPNRTPTSLSGSRPWQHPPASSDGGETVTMLRATRQPPETCAPGDVVGVDFALAGRPRELQPAYAVVERRTGDGWAVVADDGDWSTTVEWREQDDGSSRATVTWLVPADAAGVHRFVYFAGVAPYPSRPFRVG